MQAACNFPHRTTSVAPGMYKTP